MPSTVRYTQIAAKAHNLAELFKASFAAGLSGHTRYRVELAAPDGPSTAGGRQAVQHIKLVPIDGGVTIVIGSANTTTRRAEIRTYELLAEQHAQRFKGARVPVDIKGYRELTQMLANFFTSMHMKVTFEDVEASSQRLSLASGANSGGQLVVLLLLGFGMAAVVALVVVFYMQRR